jgi:hypothetical protein
VPVDIETPRFDVSAVLRLADRRPSDPVYWRYRDAGVFADWAIVVVRYDPAREEMVVDDEILIVLERSRSVLRGRRVRGPRLAVCPRLCGRRGRVLWLVGEAQGLDFACRECAGIEYATAATSDPIERARLGLRRLERQLADARPVRRARRHRRLEDRVRAAGEELRRLRRERADRLHERVARAATESLLEEWQLT